MKNSNDPSNSVKIVSTNQDIHFSFNTQRGLEFNTSKASTAEVYNGVEINNILTIVKEPEEDYKLRQISDEVIIDDNLRTFMEQYLLPSMYSAGGIGIAAIQVGLPIRAFILDIPTIQSINGQPIEVADSDPRWIRKAIANGKNVKCFEKRNRYLSGSKNMEAYTIEKDFFSENSGTSTEILEVIRNPIFIVNPIIEIISDELVENEEGCLSVPIQYLQEKFKNQKPTVKRPYHIVIHYYDLDGLKQTLHINGKENDHQKWLAIASQHEYDHLNGILFVDKILQMEDSFP